MAATVRVSRNIEVIDQPQLMGANAQFQGRFNPALVTFYDDFLYDTLSTDLYASSVGNGGNPPAVIAATANGVINIITNSSSADVTEFYCEPTWFAQQACVLEVRLKMALVTSAGVFIGFANAASATNDKIALNIAANDAVTAGTNVNDAVGFCYDTTSSSNKKWQLASVKAGGTPQSIITAAVPVNAAFEVLTVALDTAGNANFFRNGVALGHIVNAVAPANAMCFLAGVITRTTAARSLSIDYIKLWQKRVESSSILW